MLSEIQELNVMNGPHMHWFTYNEGSEYTMFHIELSALTFIHIYWMVRNEWIQV